MKRYVRVQILRTFYHYIYSFPLTTTISSLLAMMAIRGTTILPNLLH